MGLTDYSVDLTLDFLLKVDPAGTMYFGFTTPAAVVFTATNATNTFNATAHGFSNNDPVTVNIIPGSGDSLPTGLTAMTRYYVVNANANDFQLSLTEGGSAIAISDDGSGTLNCYALLLEDMSNLATLEQSGSGYARQVMTFDAAASRASANSNAPSVAASGGDFGDCVEWFVNDALTVGNVHFHGLFTTMRRITDGETFTHAVGDYDFSG